MYNSFGKYNYRNAEGICEAVKPYLMEFKCALTLSDDVEVKGDRYYIVAKATLFDYESGESHSVEARARESAEKKGMDDSQVSGATSSYARKYALNGMFLLDDTKDADTDEYHRTVNRTKDKASAAESPKVSPEVIAKSEDDAKGFCSEAQVGLIEKLVKEKGINRDEYLKMLGKKSFAELTKAQAISIINKMKG